MRLLIVLAAVIVLLALVGWITFNMSRDRPGVHLETERIREDTREALREGQELLRRGEEEVAPEKDTAEDEREPATSPR